MQTHPQPLNRRLGDRRPKCGSPIGDVRIGQATFGDLFNQSGQWIDFHGQHTMRFRTAAQELLCGNAFCGAKPSVDNMQMDTADVLKHLIATTMYKGEPLNPTRVARYAGVSQSTLQRVLMRTHKTAGAGIVKKLADFFGKTPAQIRGEEPLEKTPAALTQELVDVLAKLDADKLLKIMAYAITVAQEDAPRQDAPAEPERRATPMGRREEDKNIWMVQGSGQPLKTSSQPPSQKSPPQKTGS